MAGLHNFTVCVCIPTYNRPDLLFLALNSCLFQTRRPDSILIGDDSTDDRSAKVVQDIQDRTNIKIDYRRHRPSLGQSGNLNFLYDHADATHILLLHDDDELLPTAIEDLFACWEKNPELTAAYGKQYLMSADGVIHDHASEELNVVYGRTPDRSGLQEKSWEVGLQQFPNDGFMILAAAARKVRWLPASVVGAGGDFDFGLRLGLNCSGFYFVDKFTMKCRLTDSGSISSSWTSDTALRAYLILSETRLPEESEHLRSLRMTEMAPRAVMQAAKRGEFAHAWRIYWSEHHGWGSRLSLGGANRLFVLLRNHFVALLKGHGNGAGNVPRAAGS